MTGSTVGETSAARFGPRYEKNEIGRVMKAFDGMTEELDRRKRAGIRSEESLSHHAERLRMLHMIDRGMLEAQVDSALIQGTLGQIRRLIGCSRAAIVKLDSEAAVATILAVDAERDSRLRPGTQLPPAILGDIRALREGRTHIHSDVARAQGELGAVSALYLEADVQSFISVPLICRGELAGCLTLSSSRADAFQQEHLEAAREVADSLATALENARAFEAALQREREIMALSTRLGQIEELERKRLARELHDQAGQSLTALGINLNVVHSLLSPEASAQVRAPLEDAMAQADELGDCIRDIMAELRPPVLDDYGLLPALCSYGRRFSERTGVAIEVCGDETRPRLEADVETALFRIAQEALNNVAKYAKARRVRITLREIDRHIRLAISDDGVGFVPGDTGRTPANTGWGQVIMRERAAAVNGRVTVESVEGSGTTVTVEIER
jgi:signal transduction histidine kinase